MKRVSFDKRVLIVTLLLGVVTFLAFARVLDCGFTNFDDDTYVTDNEHVQGGLSVDGTTWAFTTQDQANWHPLTWLSLMADYQIYGLDPRGFHLTNLLLHIAGVILLFLVLRKMTRSLWRSAFVAALFAVHPLHVESVAWIAERKDVLSALFWMLTMGAYAFYAERPRVKRYLVVTLFFVCGLMAKPMLVTLPVVLLLLDYWPLARFASADGAKRKWMLVLEKAPLLALSVASSIVTLWAQQSGGALRTWEAVSLPSRVSNALFSCVAYIGKMIMPRGLAAFYPPDGIPVWQAIGATLVLGVVSVLAFRARGRAPHLGVGWLWYLITLVPVIGIVQVGEQAMADRYTYVPLIGLFVMISWGASRSMGDSPSRPLAPSPIHPFTHSPILSLVATAVIIGLAVCARIQTGYWKDSITLFEHAAAVTSSNYVAYQHIGSALMSEGMLDEAAERLSKAVEIKPDSVKSLILLGNALQRQDKLDAAAGVYQKAIGADPGYAPSYSNLGSIMMRQGRIEDAVRAYEEAIRRDPSFAMVHANLAIAFEAQGKLEEALKEDEKAIALSPRSPEFHFGMAMRLQQLGKLDEAVNQYGLAVQLKPDFAEARQGLAVALYFAGRYAEAWKEVHEHARLGGTPDPNFLRALSEKMRDPGE